MKILLIYNYNFFEPLGLMTLSAFLKEHGYECHFLDLKLEKHFETRIREIGPDIIGYSVITGHHRFYQQLNLQLKQKFSFFAVFGGPHCTFFPDFIQEDGVDAICRGEGEFPLLELSENLSTGKDITGIKNLWVKKEGMIYRNEMRDLIEDLDIIPPPDREMLGQYPSYRKKHMRFAISGRGCPYQCTYCFNHAFNELYKGKGRLIRKRSVGHFVEELRQIKLKYKPKRFKFWDDIFILDKKWISDFCQLYKKEVGLPFRIYARVDLLDEETVKNLAEAGCILVEFGIESGNDYVRNKILKRNISNEQIISASHLLIKYKIIPMGLSIFGVPDETVENAFDTLQVNINAKVKYGYSTVFHPYPMTELWDYSVLKGYFDGNINNTRDSFNFAGSPLKMKDIKKLVRFHYLFSFAVTFPAFKNILRLLIRLPFDSFYNFLYFLHKTWFYIFYLYEIDVVEIIRDILATNSLLKKTYFKNTPV